MAKGLRSSRVKTNKSRLRAQVFGPVEDARKERLSAQLIELASKPRPSADSDTKMVENGIMWTRRLVRATLADYRGGPIIDDETPLSKSEMAAGTNKKDEGMNGSMYLKSVMAYDPIHSYGYRRGRWSQSETDCKKLKSRTEACKAQGKIEHGISRLQARKKGWTTHESTQVKPQLKGEIRRRWRRAIQNPESNFISTIFAQHELTPQPATKSLFQLVMVIIPEVWARHWRRKVQSGTAFRPKSWQL